MLISDCMLNISWSEEQTLCGMFHGVGGIMHESAPMPMTNVGAEIGDYYMRSEILRSETTICTAEAMTTHCV